MDNSKEKKQQCYICGAPFYSVEHAPARSFFPKDKRNNLITVPSCKKHNEDMSIDDDYVRLIIASSITNNEVAEAHFIKKCIKTLQRSEALTKTLASGSKYVLVSKGKEPPHQELAIKIDRNRFNKVMCKIAYAMFYNKFGEVWQRKFNIGTEYLLNEDNTNEPLGKLIQEAKKLIDLSSIKFEGSEPTVFKYAFMPCNGSKFDQILIMVFYEGFEVWCFTDPTSNSPEL